MTPPDVPPIGLADLEGLRRLAGVLVRGEADADDLAMDAVVVALEKPPRAGYTPRAWLQGIARRLAANRRRADAVRRRREASAARPEAAPDDVAVAAHLARRRLVLDALTTLPADAAHVLCLRYFDDLAPREIAARLGVPVETVRTRTRRALARLRDELDRRHGGDRAAWGVALAPLVPGGDVAPAPAATHPAPSIPSPVETLAVAATAKPLLVAAAAAVLVAGAYLGVRGGAGREAPVPDALAPVAVTARTDGGELAAAATARAPHSAGPDAPPTGPATGPATRADGGVADGARVVGRVVDAAGAAVAGVRVRLVPDDALLVYLGVPVDGRWSALETTTAADGTYGFEGIRPRAGYAVLFEALGKAMAVRGGVAFVAGERARLDDLALADGATVRGTVRGTASGTVGGTVRGADGAPIAGARVGIALRPPNPLQFVLARVDRLPWRQALVTTGADGRFEVAHVAEGRAVLVVEAPGHASKVLALTVSGAGALDVPDLTLPATDAVSGTALLADGTPAVGARVLVTRDGGIAGYDAEVGADGAFSIPAVPPGVGPVFAYVPGLAPVVTPPVRTGVADVRVRFGASGRLAGRVLGPDGEPVPRFRVAVRSAAAATDLMGQFVEQALASALGPVEVVAADGRFDLGPLEARDVAVEVTAEGCVKAVVSPVTVPAGAASAPVEVRLEHEATVRGRVVDGEGRPVADASVCVQRGGVAWAPTNRPKPGTLGFEVPGFDAPVVEVRTDADGAFHVAPDAPGPLALTVRAPGLAVHFRAGFDPAVAREPLVVTLSRGASLAGRVTVTGPAPAGPMKVVAHVLQGQVVAEVGADGTYALEGLPPGAWLVVALPRGAILHPAAERRRDELVAGLGARAVTVTDGLAAAVDLVVPPLPWVVATLAGLGETGVVDDLTFRRDDAPPSSGGAGPRDPAWSPLTWSAEPRPDGTFVVRGLLPGTYTGELWVTQVSGSTTHRAVVQSQAFVRGVAVPGEARAVPLTVPIAPR